MDVLAIAPLTDIRDWVTGRGLEVVLIVLGSILLALSDAGESLRWLWILAAAAAAGWAGFAVWASRRSGR